jgi:hypothetical protein
MMKNCSYLGIRCGDVNGDDDHEGGVGRERERADDERGVRVWWWRWWEEKDVRDDIGGVSFIQIWWWYRKRQRETREVKTNWSLLKQKDNWTGIKTRIIHRERGKENEKEKAMNGRTKKNLVLKDRTEWKKNIHWTERKKLALT